MRFVGFHMPNYGLDGPCALRIGCKPYMNAAVPRVVIRRFHFAD